MSALTPVACRTFQVLVVTLAILLTSAPVTLAQGSLWHPPMLHRHPPVNFRVDNETTGHVVATDAQVLVAAAHEAMATANALILRNPRRNRYDVLNAVELDKTRKLAPPLLLDLSSQKNDSAPSRKKTRQASNNTGSTLSYTIPEGLSQAASTLAEAVPLVTSWDSYASIVERLMENFKPRTNDTNRMAQILQGYSGLMEGIVAPGHGYTLGTVGNKDNTLARRAAGAFWMETIGEHGASPFVPQDYKIWRNVKDYGAVGDGSTDDTAAIQKAITDGQRCGSLCGGSTTFPASVYFPSGTYLVSSSIIQYANTQIIGNPLAMPKIVASASFVGLGVITSEAFVTEQAEWYLNSNSQLRSIRNLVVDVRSAPQNAYVVGIHWQAARGSSLENIHFYMADPKESPETTQMGLFVENGAGGFLGDLFFVGGRIGALMTIQQFAANGLYFNRCETAVQMVWDQGRGLQNVVISDCGTGIDIVGGPIIGELPNQHNGSSLVLNGTTFMSSRRSPLFATHQLTPLRRRNESDVTPGGAATSGSASFTDMRIVNTTLGVNASLSGTSTSLLVLNSHFDNVSTIIHDSAQGTNLLRGVSGSTTNIPSWSFGTVYEADGSSRIVRGEAFPVQTRNASLVAWSPLSGTNSDDKPFFFYRRRPSYAALTNTQILDVKVLGAKGDGKSDDTGILNKVFDMAANMSAIVYIPYGVYVISDTITVPLGSRIVGQAWPQIMAAGRKFEDARNPRVAVRVGRRAEVGVIEMQGLTFTARGATAGAVLMEWNVYGSEQGSAGLWDSQFRIGGAKGTELQTSQCKAGSGASCLGATLMLHLTKESSAYLENVGLWAADHDRDGEGQGQTVAGSARGVLIESQGPTWIWGTSSEHSLLYQYSLSRAKYLVAGQLQTGSSIFRAADVAKDLVDVLPYPNDPKSGTAGDGSWAVRIANSQGIQILSTSLFGWPKENSDGQGFAITDTGNITLYNTNSVGNGAKLSAALGSSALNKRTNVTGSSQDTSSAPGSSIMAWSALDSVTAGAAANYTGYTLWTQEDLDRTDATAACQKVLMATINCHNETLRWISGPMYHGSLGDQDLTVQVCDPGCKDSVSVYISRVERICKDWKFASGAPATLQADYIYYGYNETCTKDPATGSFCNDVINDFTTVDMVEEMPTDELCSSCYTGRLQMMQASPYSVYNVYPYYQRAMKLVVEKCGITTPTDPQEAPEPTSETTPPFCVSGKRYTAKGGDTCDSIALANNVSSASLLNANKNLIIVNCTSITVGLDLCLPLMCDIYQLKDGDRCDTVAFANGIVDLAQYNPWIDSECSNLQIARPILGSIVCIGASGGNFNPGNGTGTGGSRGGGTGQGPPSVGYSDTLAPPPAGASVADRTTLNCGVWHVVQMGDTCDAMTLENGMALQLLLEVNPSLVYGTNGTCSEMIVPGRAYCVSPLRDWNTKVNFEYHLLGCYTNSDPDARVLFDSYARHPTEMIVEMCAEICLLRGYQFFGLQNGDECSCANKLYFNSVRQPPARCNLQCVGNTTETCGSTTDMNIYGVPKTVIFDYTAAGCYGDSSSGGGGVLSSKSRLGFAGNTVESCAQFCLPLYGMFGVEGGTDCWCGRKVADGAVEVDHASCDTPCAGDSDQECGAAGFVMVYGTEAPFFLATATLTTTSSIATVAAGATPNPIADQVV